MLIAQMKAALGGDLDRVERIVKLGVFIASTPDFTDQPEAANGASDLMEAVFGDAGKHARAAVSVPVLPRDATVEIDALSSKSKRLARRRLNARRTEQSDPPNC